MKLIVRKVIALLRDMIKEVSIMIGMWLILFSIPNAVGTAVAHYALGMPWTGFAWLALVFMLPTGLLVCRGAMSIFIGIVGAVIGGIVGGLTLGMQLIGAIGFTLVAVFLSGIAVHGVQHVLTRREGESWPEERTRIRQGGE